MLANEPAAGRTANPTADQAAEWRRWWADILKHHRHAGGDLCSCGKPVATCLFRVKAVERGVLKSLTA